MKTTVNTLSVLYLDRQRLDFFGGNITDKIVHLDFPPNTLKDLEVVNIDELNILIKAFIDFYKILPSRVIIIISKNAYFEKEIQKKENADLALETKLYLNSVPFENIISSSIAFENGFKIIAFNRNLLYSLKTALEKYGFIVEVALPDIVFGKDIMQKNGLDMEIGRLMLQKYAAYKMHNLFSIKEEHQIDSSPNRETEEKKEIKPKEKSKTIFLLPVFFILLSIMAYMLYYNSRTNKKPSQVSQMAVSEPKSTAAQPSLLLSPTVTGVHPSSGITRQTQNAESISIKIISSVSSREKQESLRTELERLGFTKIELETTDSINTPQTLMIVDKNLSSAMREAMGNIVKYNFPNSILQETANSQYDITLVIGKSQ
ncbi:hypothetical protein A2Y99_01995 [Candidatus Gottesmanbacteria bacterium RBG_13_37_7]|uniref:LytR/CpsA/Psr regulator C-terminal domain-containing protein n=1 Tax=Candidatus Gottesmanbacteria bacterium RBG_13_37_7 TaxID=1798369 RepID=A0A1F5YIM8_9BACT|nr:MAG: hypothetical protein A2Y99_01995 [Candidatus Gottesmanbacteria bacterium RBG_13_37_7]